MLTCPGICARTCVCASRCLCRPLVAHARILRAALLCILNADMCPRAQRGRHADTRNLTAICAHTRQDAYTFTRAHRRTNAPTHIRVRAPGVHVLRRWPPIDYQTIWVPLVRASPLHVACMPTRRSSLMFPQQPMRCEVGPQGVVRVRSRFSLERAS